MAKLKTVTNKDGTPETVVLQKLHTPEESGPMKPYERPYFEKTYQLPQLEWDKPGPMIPARSRRQNSGGPVLNATAPTRQVNDLFGGDPAVYAGKVYELQDVYDDDRDALDRLQNEGHLNEKGFQAARDRLRAQAVKKTTEIVGGFFAQIDRIISRRDADPFDDKFGGEGDSLVYYRLREIEIRQTLAAMPPELRFPALFDAAKATPNTINRAIVRAVLDAGTLSRAIIDDDSRVYSRTFAVAWHNRAFYVERLAADVAKDAFQDMARAVLESIGAMSNVRQLNTEETRQLLLESK